jgi:hypothetical protein
LQLRDAGTFTGDAQKLNKHCEPVKGAAPQPRGSARAGNLMITWAFNPSLDA